MNDKHSSIATRAAFDDGETIVERNAARALREAALLMRVARLISTDLNFDAMLARLQSLLAALMPADRIVVVDGLLGERAALYAHPSNSGSDDTNIGYAMILAQTAASDTGASILTRTDVEQVLAKPAEVVLPPDLHSLALAPLMQNGIVSGTLLLEAHRPDAVFIDEDAQLLAAVALYLATVLERDRALLEARRRMDQMGAFSAVTSTVNEWVDVEQLARRFLSVFLNITHTSYGLFYLLEGEEEMRLVAHFGVPMELVESMRVGHVSLHPDVKRAVEQGRLTVLEDVARAAISEAARQIAALIPIRSTLILPLRIKGRGMGIIVLGNSEGAAEVADREFVQGLADQAAQAIENARLFAESQRRFQEQSALRELAQHFLTAVTPDEVLDRTLDALTGLLPGDYYEVLLPSHEGALFLANGRGWRRGVIGRTRTVSDPHLHAGYVLRAQLPVIVENFFTETRFQPSDYLMRHQVVSGVCAPMLAETRVIGLLGVYSRAPRQFSEEQSHFLYLVATQTAMALEKARHSQAATRRLDELILLNDVIAAANSEVSLERVLASVTAEIRELLQSEDVRIYFAHVNGGAEMVLEPALSSAQNEAPGVWSRMVARWVVRESEPLLIHDLTHDLRFNSSGEEVRACLGVPMKIGERVIGVVTVAHPDVGRFDANDLRLLTTLAGQIAAAIERARLLDETATRLAEISAMFEFSDKLRTATTEMRLHELIVNDAVSMLQGTGGSLQIVLDDGNTMRVVATKNMPHRGLDIPRSIGGLSWIAFQTGEPFVIEDVAADGRSNFPAVFHEMHGGIVAPLRTPSGILGTLFIGFAEPGAPSQDRLRLTTTIANHAAQALHRLRLHEQTLEQAASLAVALGNLEESYQATLLALSAALDARDRETEGHSQRVTKLALAIGRELKLSPEELTSLERGALLHDVGKIGISDNILRKTGPLTQQERELMHQHPILGYNMLKGIPFLQDALPVVLYHQEMWDGSGYPEGLRGSQIPLGARIFSVADTYDAMTSTRPYRKALSHEEAVREITRCRGTQFDPLVVDAFLELFRKQKQTD
jgi:GAF domain-containing protein